MFGLRQYQSQQGLPKVDEQIRRSKVNGTHEPSNVCTDPSGLALQPAWMEEGTGEPVCVCMCAGDHI